APRCSSHSCWDSVAVADTVITRSVDSSDSASTDAQEERRSGAFARPSARRRYILIAIVLAVLAVGSAFGVLAWGNPMPYGTDGFWRIAGMRATSLVVIGVVAFCQAIATVAFQTVANNRIVTPSIMGFESLYVAVQ